MRTKSDTKRLQALPIVILPYKLLFFLCAYTALLCPRYVFRNKNVINVRLLMDINQGIFGKHRQSFWWRSLFMYVFLVISKSCEFLTSGNIYRAEIEWMMFITEYYPSSTAVSSPFARFSSFFARAFPSANLHTKFFSKIIYFIYTISFAALLAGAAQPPILKAAPSSPIFHIAGEIVLSETHNCQRWAMQMF